MAEPPGCATDPGVAAVVRDAAAKLADAGFAVEEASPPDYEEALSSGRTSSSPSCTGCAAPGTDHG